MTDEEHVIECQREIGRLRGVVTELQDEIKFLRRKTYPGVDIVRSAVIGLMVRTPELNKLENEDWYTAENTIVNFINDYIEETKNEDV